MISNYINKLRLHGRALLTAGKSITEAKMLTARLLIDRMAEKGLIADIREAEFKVFSQFGEDGIIQYLVKRAQIREEEKALVEFGSDFYGEANTRFLLMNDYWRGLLIDGSRKSIEIIRRQPLFWERDLTAVAAFIDAENVNELIGSAGYRGLIGLLSIDIDGNDYWVWEKISVIDPVIVVAEYNSLFGAARAVTVPYNPKFYRLSAHYSGLYFGCSLKALELLGARKGYALVGSNRAGNNCFFVKRDRLNGQAALSAPEAYVKSQFRDMRDSRGEFTFIADHSMQRAAIAELPLIDVETGATIHVRDLQE